MIGLENQFSVFMRVAVLHRFYCFVGNLVGGVEATGRFRFAKMVLLSAVCAGLTVL